MNLQQIIALLLLPLFIGLGPAVFAQSNPKKTEQRKQSLTFEDELVEGSTQKPELFYLFQKKNFNYKRLIKLRENFIPEMRRNSEDVVKKTER